MVIRATVQPEVILGPPGTGKTTALIAEVEAELARGVPPDRIGFVTFTRRGAEEATTRARNKFNLSSEQLPWFRTLHSLCFRQLGLSRGDVFEGKRVREFADYAGVQVTGRWSEDGTLAGFGLGDRILFMENLARIATLPLRDVYLRDDDHLPWAEVSRVAACLQKFKQDHSLLDFTDMLAEFVAVDSDLGLEVLFVDEAQDNTPLQWEVIRLLGRSCRRVVVAGDDDQAIYAWAGADVEALIAMGEGARVLGQSWRVPVAVQAAASVVISGVTNRRDKQWAARDGSPGEVIQAVDFAAADMSLPWAGDGVQPILVLARNTYVIEDQVVPELRRRGVLYERYGHPSVKRAMMVAIDAWEDLRRGRKIQLEAARAVYDHMSSGKGFKRGNKTLPKFKDRDEVSIEDLEADGGLITRAPWYDALDRLPHDDVAYVRAARQRGEDLRGRPRVRLSTIHGSKGGQAHHVVVMREMARRTHYEMQKKTDDERRVWYVAATRSRERLTVVSSPTAMACPWL